MFNHQASDKEECLMSSADNAASFAQSFPSNFAPEHLGGFVKLQLSSWQSGVSLPRMTLFLQNFAFYFPQVATVHLLMLGHCWALTEATSEVVQQSTDQWPKLIRGATRPG